MATVTRGFLGRRREHDPRLPPGQYDTGNEWPVLRRGHATAGDRAVDVPRRRPGRAADDLDVGRDPRAAAVPLRRRHPLRHNVVEARHDASAAYPSTRCSPRPGRCRKRPTCSPSRHTGYTTNLPLADVTDGKAWVVWDYEGRPLAAEHGGPARLLVPHLYFWKSAKWVAGCACSTTTSRVLGAQRLPRPRRPVARAALPGRLSDRRATEPAAQRGRCDLAGPAHRAPRCAHATPTARRRSGSRCRAAPPPAGQHYVVRLTAHDGYTAARSYSVASRARRPARDRADRGAARRRRGVGVPARRRRAGRRARGAGADRRLVRVGRRPPGPARRRRLGRGAADGDAAPGPPHRPRRPAAVAGVGPHAETTSTTPASCPARDDASSTPARRLPVDPPRAGAPDRRRRRPAL